MICISKILFNKAKDYYFRLKESGFDPDRAENLTALRFGNRLAKEIYELDVVKKNPRLFGKKREKKPDTRTLRDFLVKGREISPGIWRSYDMNPRDNKIKIGKVVDDENGIEKMVVIEVGHPSKTNYRVWVEPTSKGKDTKAYREIRSKLGDDWYSDITDSWYETRALTEKMQVKISKIIDELRAEGYTRY